MLTTLSGTLSDVRHAWRVLKREPGFACVASDSRDDCQHCAAH
jgi:hypothetical protein